MLLNRKENPHGGDIYNRPGVLDFSSNINPEGMPACVKQAVIDAAQTSEVYPDPCCVELRQAIAREERLPVGWILCGNGSAELIYSFAYSLPETQPALIVSPSFSEYGAALRAAGVRAEHYLLKEEQDFRLTDDFLKTDFRQYSAVFLCSPNNPTGITVEPELIRSIAKSGVRLFLDLCFLDLTDDPARYDLPRLLRGFPNVTVLRAFTKNYAMAGLRLGYVLSSDHAFLQTVCEKTPCWNVSTVAQQAGIAAMGCGEWLRRSVAFIRAERERMAEELRACGVRVYPGEADFLLLYSEKDLYEQLLEQGILTRDCSNYVGLRKGFLRVAVRKREENDRLLSAIWEVTK